MSETEIEDAALAEAMDRGASSLARLGRLDLASLSRLSLSTADLETRSVDREIAVRAAEHAGLGSPLREMRAEARAYVSRGFDQGGFLAIGVDLGDSRSRASTDDRVAVMVAAEDDVIAAIADPFIAEDVRIALTTPMERLQAMRSPAPEPRPDGIDAHDHPRARIGQREMVAGFVILVTASLLLAVIGSGIGLFGLAAAIGIALVAIVVRGHAWP